MFCYEVKASYSLLLSKIDTQVNSTWACGLHFRASKVSIDKILRSLHRNCTARAVYVTERIQSIQVRACLSLSKSKYDGKAKTDEQKLRKNQCDHFNF